MDEGVQKREIVLRVRGSLYLSKPIVKRQRSERNCLVPCVSFFVQPKSSLSAHERSHGHQYVTPPDLLPIAGSVRILRLRKALGRRRNTNNKPQFRPPRVIYAAKSSASVVAAAVTGLGQAHVIRVNHLIGHSGIRSPCISTVVHLGSFLDCLEFFDPLP